MGHVVASIGGLLFFLLSCLFTAASASQHPTSELLWQARQCIDSGRYLDFFSDPVSENLPCVSRCPTFSVVAYQTCVGAEHRSEAQEVALTLHTVCDYTCFYDSGVELSSRLWMGLARVLHVPLAEMSASILILHTSNREWLTLEHFFMWRDGIDNLAMPTPSAGKYSTGVGAFDLFMAVRIHTSRLFYNSQPLSSLVSGNAASLTALVDHQLGTVVFQATRRRVDLVETPANTVPRFKFEDRGWNENPWSSSSSSSRRRTTTAPSTGSQGGGTSSTCSRGCYEIMVGDGVCQAACYTSACRFDMGDCSTSSHTDDDDDDGRGSGSVTSRATTSRSSTSPACPCSPEQLGNAMCDAGCNVAACNYDGGDCTTSTGRRRSTTTMSMPRTCGCASYFLGDGICDSWCNNAECDFDHGDCDTPDANGGSGARRATSTTTRSTQTTRTSHTSTTSSRSSTITSASSTSSAHYTALRGGAGAASGGDEDIHDGDHSAIDVIVEEHEEDRPTTWRVLASNSSGKWYMDEPRRTAEETAGNPLKSAVFIIAFFAVLGAMTVIGVCLVAKGISPGSRRRKRFPAFNLDGEEDDDNSWMSPTRPTSSTATKGASAPQKAAPWSAKKDGKEHLRDFMHWRPKRSYSRAASAQATRAKEQMGPKSGWKVQGPPSKGMPADVRSASKTSVSSEDSESTAVGSHSTPSSSFSAQNSWRASDTAFSWTFSGYKERVREPKVHPEPSAPTEDSRGAWFFNNSSRCSNSSPLRMAASSSWKEPARPPPPPPMPSMPPVAPTGPAPRSAAGTPAFTTARAMSKQGGGRMTATKSDPTFATQSRHQSTMDEHGNHHYSHHHWHHSNPTSSSPPAAMKMGAASSSSAAKPSRSAEQQQPHFQQKQHGQPQQHHQPQSKRHNNEEEASRPKVSPAPPAPKAENRSTAGAGKANTEAAWRTLFGLRGGNGGTDAGVRPSRSHRHPRNARSTAEAPAAAAATPQQPPPAQPQQHKPKQDVPKTGSSGRSPSHPPPPSQKEPQQKRAQSVPASSTKTSKWWAGPTARKPPDPETQSKSLISDMEKQLASAKNEPLEARKHIFKELQRQLHPDKNIDQPEAAKLAFQKLMEQRAAFLAP